MFKPARAALLPLVFSSLFAADLWAIERDGAIVWNVQPGTGHEDHIEMSGRKVSVIVRYGVDAEGRLVLRRQVVFPMLRSIPNDTHASLSFTFGEDAMPRILVDGRLPRPEVVRTVRHRGILSIEAALGQVTLKR